MELCRITGDFPGGNIKVVSMRGREIGLDVEMRDSSGDWFYWCFQAHFREPGTYHFQFQRPGKVGTRGPAVSLDGGMHWRWLSAGRWNDSQGFDYVCPKADDEVLFCTGIQYLQRDLEAFLKEFAGTPFLRSAVLCRSRKGRKVELVSIAEGHPEYTVLLTSRHHSVEMMATHVLEGILRAALEATEFGRTFRRKIALFAVPFVDKDGVEDGDQGKNRMPHDHARDYQDPALYPETAALRNWISRNRPDFLLDLHCPLLAGALRENPALIGSGNSVMDAAMDRFSDCLEQYRVPEAPYWKQNNIPFGSAWNVAKNFTQGLTLVRYAASLPFVSSAQTMEIPFANFGEITADRDSMLRFGGSIARAILLFLQGKNAG